MKTLYFVVPVVLSLAACGGSSTGGSAFSSTQGAVDVFDALIDKSDRLDLTPVENIPTSGSASYEGVFSLARIVERFPDDPDPDIADALVGEVELDIDFQSNTVSGNANNFFGANGSVSGALTISEGEIFRDATGALFGADVAGQLPINGAQRDIAGGIVGTFGGNQSQLVEGIFFGEADGIYPLFGAVIADE